LENISQLCSLKQSSVDQIIDGEVICRAQAYMIWRKALNRDKGHQWFKQLLLDGIKKLRGE